jgi:hypothetical protein
MPQVSDPFSPYYYFEYTSPMTDWQVPLGHKSNWSHGEFTLRIHAVAISFLYWSIFPPRRLTHSEQQT